MHHDAPGNVQEVHRLLQLPLGIEATIGHIGRRVKRVTEEVQLACTAKGEQQWLGFKVSAESRGASRESSRIPAGTALLWHLCNLTRCNNKTDPGESDAALKVQLGWRAEGGPKIIGSGAK